MSMQITNAFNNCLLVHSQKENNPESAISKIVLKPQQEYLKI